MAQSTGGFWSSPFGQLVGGLFSPVTDQAMNREMTANENDLSRQHDEYMSRLSQSNALQQMRVQQANALAQMKYQQDYNKYMADTQYQRMVNDMEAAGINPASLMGSVHAAGSTGSASTVGASTPGAAASSSRGLGYSGQNDFMTSMMTSALNGMIAKDRDASKYLASEMVDNARHAHRMEEISEWQNYAVAKKAANEASIVRKTKWKPE